jgi:hypothetical protein
VERFTAKAQKCPMNLYTWSAILPRTVLALLTYHAWLGAEALVEQRDLWTDAKSGPNTTASSEEVVGHV